MEKDYTIVEPITEQDLLDMKLLNDDLWLETYPSIEAGVSYEVIEKIILERQRPENIAASLKGYRESLADSQCFFRIAKSEDRVIGSIYSDKKNEIQVLGIYVASEYHGVGVAADLMEEALNWLDSSRPISFEVIEHNTRAIRFYEKHGFQVVPDSRRIYRECLPVITMISSAGLETKTSG